MRKKFCTVRNQQSMVEVYGKCTAAAVSMLFSSGVVTSLKMKKLDCGKNILNRDKRDKRLVVAVACCL